MRLFSLIVIVVCANALPVAVFATSDPAIDNPDLRDDFEEFSRSRMEVDQVDHQHPCDEDLSKRELGSPQSDQEQQNTPNEEENRQSRPQGRDSADRRHCGNSNDENDPRGQ